MSDAKRYSVVLTVPNDSPFRQTGDSCTRSQHAEVVLASDYAALESELARLRAGQEPVAYITGYHGGRCIIEPVNRAAVLPSGMALYATPQPSAAPDMIELAAFIRQIDGNNRMGAGVLAERICEWLAAAPSAPKADDPVKGEVKCATCRDVGIIGHSLICPECADSWEPATVQADAVKAKQSEVCDVCEGKGYVNVGDGDAQVACPFCDLPASPAIAAARKGEV